MTIGIDKEKTQWTKYFNSLESISKELRTVDDMMEVLRTPINLADRTFINKINNVINLASGTMKYPAHSSEAYGRWTENVTKVLKYFGIDATDGFTINGTKYQKNEKGWFEAQR